VVYQKGLKKRGNKNYCDCEHREVKNAPWQSEKHTQAYGADKHKRVPGIGSSLKF
jgi:hypothetical protein